MVTLELPDPAQAPGYRDFLTAMCEFRLQPIAGRWVGLAPSEGAGQVRRYFETHKVCDATTALCPEIWEPLRRNPAWEDPDHARRLRLLQEADRLGRLDTPQAALNALQAGIAGAVNDTPDFLEAQLPHLFEGFPDGSLWLISVDQVLLGRLAFLRSRYALELTPDIHIHPDEFIELRALEGHSISRGVSFAELLKPLLLIFSPGAIGYAFDFNPHALVFLFGGSNELRDPQPRSFASIFQRPLVGHPDDEPWADPDFFTDIDPGDAESLLCWWVTRLNILYSHAADPAGFERVGRHDPDAQYAWFLTIEQLLLGIILVLGAPQEPQAVRQQAAFDLLDKAEALLGYRMAGSGKGFKRLLRRTHMVSRLDQAWEQLPIRLRARFRSHVRELFDHVYKHAREHAVSFRVTQRAVKVAREQPHDLRALPMDSYVPDIVRAVRNAAHGFLEQIKGPDRFLIATHDGHLSPQTADLAAMIAFGLVTDAERLCSTDWF